MRIPFLALTLFLSAGGAHAEDASADRDELDAAAGRTLFQNSPLALSIADRPRSPEPPPVATTLREGRRVRIVYPGPYSR